MGKIRRPRKKLHLQPSQSKPTSDLEKPTDETSLPEFVIPPQENPFAGVPINIDSLKKSLSDDIRSVKSYKSVKSESEKVLSKKDKIKLRRELLMKKFEVMKEQKQLAKKKKTVGGDLNPLRDALPSLDSLLKSRGNVPYKQKPEKKKKRGIEKSKNIKKSHLQGIKLFQQILKNKEFQKDPQAAISQHIKAVLDNENNR